MPTSTNQGIAYSESAQRFASMVAGKNADVSGANRSSGRIQPAAANSGVQTDVELEDVGVADPRVEPLHVELVPLVGRVRRVPLDDADLRMLLGEPGELGAQHPRLRSEDTDGQGDLDALAGLISAPQAERREQDKQEAPHRFIISRPSGSSSAGRAAARPHPRLALQSITAPNSSITTPHHRLTFVTGATSDDVRLPATQPVAREHQPRAA